MNIKEEGKVGSPPPGFYQVLYRGKDVLLKKIRKIYQEPISQSYTEGANNKLERYFKTAVTYYLFKEHVYYLVKNRSSIINL